MKRFLIALGLLFGASLNAATFVQDNMNGVAGTLLNAHTGQVGATWTKNTAVAGTAQLTNANRLRPTGGTDALYYASGAPASADYSVGAQFFVASVTNDYMGVTGRYSTSANSGYIFVWENSNAAWALYREIAGAGTRIAAAAVVTPTAGNTYRMWLVFKGSLITGVVNDTVIFTVTDTTFAAAGVCGTYSNGPSSTDTVGYQLSYFYACDGAPILTPTFRNIGVDGTGQNVSVALNYAAGSPLGQLAGPILPTSGITGFTIATNSGQAVSISSATATGTTVTLALSRVMYAGEQIIVSYAPGNLTDSFLVPDSVASFTTSPAFSGLAPPTGTNEVKLGGAPFGDAGTSGHLLAAAFNSNTAISNYFLASGGAPQYIGLDAGSAVILRHVKLTARSGDGTTDFEELLKGCTIQGSNTSNSAGFVNLWTVPSTEPFYIPRIWRSSIPINAGGVAYRWYRLLQKTGVTLQLTQLEFDVDNGATSAQPMMPVISPYGGRFPSGSTMVTMTTTTSSAAIYYTTDGSSPTNASTLYTQPFNLTIAPLTPVTVKAIAYDAGQSTATSDIATGIFNPNGYIPNTDWYDDRGILIEAHSGSMIFANGLYWWYGDLCNKANAASGQTADMLSYKGVWCYSSPDLLNWTFVGQVLPCPSGYVETPRAHVLYNSANNNYVMWVNVATSIGIGGPYCMATALQPQGPWTYARIGVNVDGNTSLGDFHLFLDDDGVSAYVVYNNNALTMQINKLSSDFLDTVGGTATTIYTGISPNREAPALTKFGSIYFLISSQSNYYNSASTFSLAYSTSPDLVTWTAMTNLYATDPVGTNYNSQPTHVVKIGTGNYLYMSDFWNVTTLYNSRYVFQQLIFPDTLHVVPPQPTQWSQLRQTPNARSRLRTTGAATP